MLEKQGTISLHRILGSTIHFPQSFEFISIRRVRKKGNIIEEKDQQTSEETPVAFAQREFGIVFPFFHPRQKAKKIVYVIETGGQGHVLHTHPLPCHVFTLRARARVLRLHRHVYIRTGRLCINKCKR